MPEPLRVGIAGLGTVGCGTIGLVRRNGAAIAARTGRRVEVAAVSARVRDRERAEDVSGLRWHDDPLALAADPGVDAVCELIGGEGGVALELARATLRAGKPLVTANKAMLAHRGAELAALAEARGVALAFEAAVAGGIPVVRALREGLAGDRVASVRGILNGTSNHILTAMRETGRDFAGALGEAQALGYAEADPAFDVDGTDAAHKLALLAAIAFGAPPDFAAVHVEGIRGVTPLDVAFAEELGYRIKLLGTARLTEAGLEQRLHPAMVPKELPIAGVEGVLNAVVLEGEAAGPLLLVGRGAGAGPTAAAVLADLVDVARGAAAPAFGAPVARLRARPPAPMAAHRGRFYLRLQVVDRPGVLAEVAAALRDADVSIEGLIQRARDPGRGVPIVLTTHGAVEAAVQGALAAIAALPSVLESPRMIRIEAAP